MEFKMIKHKRRTGLMKQVYFVAVNIFTEKNKKTGELTKPISYPLHKFISISKFNEFK